MHDMEDVRLFAHFSQPKKLEKLPRWCSFAQKKITWERNSPSQGEKFNIFRGEPTPWKRPEFNTKIVLFAGDEKNIQSNTVITDLDASIWYWLPNSLDGLVPRPCLPVKHPHAIPRWGTDQAGGCKKKKNVAFLQRKHNWVRFDNFLFGEKRQFSKIRGPKHCPPACLTQKKCYKWSSLVKSRVQVIMAFQRGGPWALATS